VTIDTWSALVMGLFGAAVGSFLNVCICRLPAELSVVKPRSRCPRCELPVAWYDNIPVISWILLRGRCRGCKEPIGVMYPLVELMTAAIWAWMGWHSGLSITALQGALFGTLLLGIAMTDAREYIIPDEFSLGGLGIGLILSVAGGLSTVITAIIGAAFGFGLLWLVGTLGTWAFKEEAMGGGDVKMMAMVGAFLGWEGVLLTVFLGALSGAAIFLPLSLLGRKKLVPFGVFLALGAAITYVWGPDVVEWYRRYAGFA
jgi:leader peptidase (prepilin peptidase)/N-methyltransferase